MALEPTPIDVFLALQNQTPANHQGPIGRLSSLINGQVSRYLPATQDTPQRIKVEQREAFVSAPTEVRDSTTGAVTGGAWTAPRLLETLGDQQVSIGSTNVPRVRAGSSWTEYGGSRVLTGALAEDVLHTSNRTIQASDSATLGLGVTCAVWTETTSTDANSYVGFRTADGAWLVVPQVLAAGTPANPSMARVVSDGVVFWVFHPDVGGRIRVRVYDAHGAQLATSNITVQNWTVLPGYWDIIATPSTIGGFPYTVKLAQPAAFSGVGADVHVQIISYGYAAGVISTVGGVDASINCVGPVAWATNDLNTLAYLGTYGTAGELFGYEIVNNAQTHAYAFTTAVLPTEPDSITGWVVAGAGGVDLYLAYSTLAPGTATSGPTFDPGLRKTITRLCTRAGVVSLVKTSPEVIQVSRAFAIDGEYYATTYYQSGGGRARAPTVLPVTAAGSMYGAQVQKIVVQSGDSQTGAPISVSVTSSEATMTPTQAIGASAHTVGDSVVADPLNGKATWTIATMGFNANLPSTPSEGSLLAISGSAIGNNNTSYYVTKRISLHVVETRLIGLNGLAATSEALTGVTSSLVAQAAINIQSLSPSPFTPAQLATFTPGGVLTVTSFGVPANNGTYTVNDIVTDLPVNTIPCMSFYVSRLVPAVPVVAFTHDGITATLTPSSPERWTFNSLPQFVLGLDDPIGGVPTMNLNVEDFANPTNSGSFPITSVASSTSAITLGQPQLQYQVFAPATAVTPLPVVTKSLVNPGLAYTMTFTGAGFTPAILGAIIVIAGTSPNPLNRGAYRITQVIDADHIRVVPTLGTTTQVNEIFPTGMGTDTQINIIISDDPAPSFQPTWFLTPLRIPQMTAGRWERGIAYADWRFDAATVPNFFRQHVSSIHPDGLSHLQIVLPYRAESFTSGAIEAQGNVFLREVGTNVATVGLKVFHLAGAPMGQAFDSSGVLMLPGPMAGQFIGQSFREHAINLAPERPFVISQAVVELPLAMTPGAVCQYVAVFEVTDENGNRIFSPPSPPLDVIMNGANNSVTIGGRLLRPTNWPVDPVTFKPDYAIAIYRTSNAGGVPTVQHYKITNDLDINGAGFTFPDDSTWQFVDTKPDISILSAEVLYTDRGFLPRFPAPAFRQGAASWRNRDWVIGYDGAIWMSGEKTEGDATWYHPAFRYVLATDDQPVAVAPNEDFLLVFCEHSCWYIPTAQFPDATGQNGTLPTPVELPFQSGCTGFVAPIKGGVAYASAPSAGSNQVGAGGGIWHIDRRLQNSWLSQPVQDSLDRNVASGGVVTGMAFDAKQRLFVSLLGSTDLFVYDEVTKGWYDWRVPTAPILLSAWKGDAVYQDAAHVNVHTPGTFADNIGGVVTGIAMDLRIAFLNFANVRGLKHVWEFQLVGEYKGLHRLNVELSYPDEDQPVTTYPPYVPDPAGTYVFAFNPMVEEASTFAVHVFTDFVGVVTPGNSMTLELVSAEVGIERGGLNKRPDSKRLG